MEMREIFSRRLVIKKKNKDSHSSFIGAAALPHVKPHIDRLQVNQFRHANLLPHVTDSCCM